MSVPPPAGQAVAPRQRRAQDSSSTALRAFVYLTATSARNRLRRQLRRMRQPRYAAATVLAVVYLSFFLLPGWRVGNESPASIFLRDDVLLLGSVASLVLVAYWWLLGQDSGALAFSEAEVQFLFPAPATRRQLIQFKLLRVQVVILLNIVLWSVILGRGRGDGTLIWVRPLSLWVLLSTMHFHRLGATLTRTSLVSHGTAGLRRSGPSVVLLILMLGAVVAGTVMAWPHGGRTSPFDLFRALETAASQPPAAWALYPVRAVLAPTFATTYAEWGRAIVAAIAIMLLHFAWVLRSDAAFEDAAVQASAVRAKRAAARRDDAAIRDRTSARRLAFRLPLAPRGEPALAIVWKNVLAAVRGRHFFTQAVIFCVGALVAGVAAYFRPQLSGLVTGIVVTGSVMLLAMGPIWLRTDLRADLPRMELLRTYPVEPGRLVAAELGSTALILTALQTLLVAAVLIGTLREPEFDLPSLDRLAIAIAAVPGMLILNSLGAAIHNAFALLLPEWMPLGAERKSGVEAMGQIYLMLIFVVVLLAVLLLLPAAAGALAFFALFAQYGYWAAIAAVAAGGVVALGEIGLLVRWLAGVLERTEPADIGVVG